MQVADGVEDRVAGGELVVDEDERPVAGEERGVLGQQQVGGGVGVRLLEAAGRRHARHGPAGGVQVRGGAQAVRDAVAEPGGGLGVAEDHGGRRCLVAEQRPYAGAEPVAGGVHRVRGLRDVLAQHLRDEQVRPLGVAPQGQAQQIRQPRAQPRPRPRTPFGVVQADAQPVRHPGTRPHLVDRLALPRRLLRHRPAHTWSPAVSRSTKPTCSFATPKTSARSMVRSAQARWGFTSFILFV